MEEKTKKYLPLGSIILMKDGTKKLMITGYMVKSPQSGEKIWDYMGCLWPEGIFNSEESLMFDHKDIEQVVSSGYIDDEQKSFMKVLEQTDNNTSSENVETLDL